MARLTAANPKNVPGALFTDTSCIDCGTCYHLAPTVFAEVDELSVVVKQPLGEEWERAKAAILSCPTNSIGVSAPSEDFAAAPVLLPLAVTANIYYCGYTARESYGASSYLIVRPEGNILVDSPRFNAQLVKRLEELGGVDFMFLTHQDDVADHKEFALHFRCQRIIHKDDVSPDTAHAELILAGDADVELAPGVTAIMTPGHTKGSMVLLYQHKYLFSGDHLFYSPERDELYASRGVNWYSWPRQVESVAKLRNYDFDWVLPGHGGWMHAPAARIKGELERIYSTSSSSSMSSMRSSSS